VYYIFSQQNFTNSVIFLRNKISQIAKTVSDLARLCILSDKRINYSYDSGRTRIWIMFA